MLFVIYFSFSSVFAPISLTRSLHFIWTLIIWMAFRICSARLCSLCVFVYMISNQDIVCAVSWTLYINRYQKFETNFISVSIVIIMLFQQFRYNHWTNTHANFTFTICCRSFQSLNSRPICLFNRRIFRRRIFFKFNRVIRIESVILI